MRKKKNKEKNEAARRPKWHEVLRPETKHSIWAISCFAVSLILLLAYFGEAGWVGGALQKGLQLLFGKGFWLASLAFLLAGVSFLFALGNHLMATTVIGGLLFLISSLGLSDLIFGEYTGGYIGFFASYPLLKLFDFWAAFVIFGSVFLASLLIMLNFPLKFKRKDSMLRQLDFTQVEKDAETAPIQAAVLAESGGRAAIGSPQGGATANSSTSDVFPRNAEERDNESFLSRTFFPKPTRQPKAVLQRQLSYIAPHPDLLEDDKGTPSSGDVKANANIIKRTLQNFGIDVEMSEVNVGPSVTQYTLKPAEGIKLSRITALHNDLALALAAHPLRIEAPIPGKSLVGIEVPNRSIALVGLRNMLSMDDFKNAPPLSFALGRDVAGHPIFADIAKMPHLLVAGATGAGKSIAIHTLITSLLYKNSPDFLRFLMIDPKRVELTIYNNLPHLLLPAITDAKKAIISLRWAVREMERRYEKLEEGGVRDVISFNTEMIKEKSYDEIMPNILIVIDELADLMAAYPREMESSIVRLAQMSRAVGIHLVISTQRPSVEVITGLIKANITARMALQVASGVDSRTILDMSGAEKLLGNGDMLYLAGDTSKPKRIQGAFISEKEVKRVVGHVVESAKEFAREPIDLNIKLPAMETSSQGLDDGEEVDDELYNEARGLVIEAQKASASYLQRRLRIGYARAASILDMLEERNVIGPGEGAKPRDVLVKPERNIGAPGSAIPKPQSEILDAGEVEESEDEDEPADLPADATPQALQAGSQTGREKNEIKKGPAKGGPEMPYTNFDF